MGTLTIEFKKPKTVGSREWESVGRRLLEYAIDISPIDTGRFASSWTLFIYPDSMKLYDSAEYGSFLDRGHSRQAPQGLTRPLTQKIKELLGITRISHTPNKALDMIKAAREAEARRQLKRKKRIFSFNTTFQ